MGKKVSVLFFSISIPLILLANGGPSDASLVQRTGDIQFIRKDSISLDYECIYLEIDGDFVNVQVNYTFTNHGQQDTVSYSFPVDYLDEYGMIEWQYHGEWGSECLPYFKMFDERGELATRTVDEKDSVSGEIREGEAFYERFFKRRWYNSSLIFPANSTRHLMVSYRVKASYIDFTTNKDYTPIYDLRVFRYDMSPSSHWGNGSVKRFQLTLNAREQLTRGMKIDSLKLPGITLKGDGTYFFEKTDFNLANAGNILILYDNSVPNEHKLLEEGRAKAGQITSIRASSQGGEQYGVENLLDGDPTTAWVEGVPGDGEGQWIEVEFRDFTPHGVAILNGYTKSKNTFKENNRINDFTCEFFDADGNPVAAPAGDGFGEGSLNERDYSDYNPNSPWAFASYVFMEVPDIPATLTEGKIRITIRSVYPGTKYHDTAISELLLWHDPTLTNEASEEQQE